MSLKYGPKMVQKLLLFRAKVGEGQVAKLGSNSANFPENQKLSIFDSFLTRFLAPNGPKTLTFPCKGRGRTSGEIGLQFGQFSRKPKIVDF